MSKDTVHSTVKANGAVSPRLREGNLSLCFEEQGFLLHVSYPELSSVSFPFIQGTSRDFIMPATMLALGIQRITKYHQPQTIHRAVKETAT